MQVKFQVGFCDYEILDLNEQQVSELLDYLLNTKGDLYQNQAFVATLKSGRTVDEYEMNISQWDDLLGK